MEVGDWITLVAVIVALGIGVASILHTQNLQKKSAKSASHLNKQKNIGIEISDHTKLIRRSDIGIIEEA